MYPLRGVKKKVQKSSLFLLIVCTGLIFTFWHYPSTTDDFKQKTETGIFYHQILGLNTTFKLAHHSNLATLKTPAESNTGSRIEETVKQCMAVSNVNQKFSNFSSSQKHGWYLYDQYRKIIPKDFLDGYLSHCWRISYSVHWTETHVEGHIGNRTFERTFNRNISERDSRAIYILSHLSNTFPSRKFQSDKMCLPNVFLAGFPKCGSSYLYCVITRLIDYATKRPGSHHEATKEPHFWVSAGDVKDTHVPATEDVLRYFLNFLPGLQQSPKYNQSQILLVDGSPNMFFKWPHWFQAEDNLTNYCLIPSVLPNLLPNSKYVVIMRNPVSMMFSAFWFSCTSHHGELPMSVQLKGPRLFHDKVLEKITLFNKCMRDTTVEKLNYTCPVDSKQAYSNCIFERLHLLDRCIHQITFDSFSSDFPGCGRTRLAMGVYYVHIRKWLTVVAKERFLFLTLEDLVKDPNAVMHNILKYLNLKSGTGFDSIVTQTKSSCSTKSNSQKFVDYKRNSMLSMRIETKTLLNIFFYPFNKLLANLTNRSIMWKEY